ncbi:MAG: RNA polymerase sigma factor RpoD/SigA [Treponema sp.]|jgi:RNA polymerase primary sigma factor|nr:RNA polymerase sigma factor RpoD/SigA [Treponema sp.]
MKNDTLLQTYYKQIKTIPLLSFDEELELSKRITKGDDSALKRLVEANLRLVLKIALSYIACEVGLMDIIQEGNIGLIYAANKYDYKKNVHFATYAAWWIKQAIARYFTSGQRLIRLPERKEKLFRAIKRASRHLNQELMREPSPEEIANELGISVRDVKLILNTTGDFAPLDIENTEAEETSLLNVQEDYTYNPELEFVRKTSKEAVMCFLKTLKENERRVIMYRYQFNGKGGRTLKHIGAKMGLSAEAVRQIEKRALKRLRQEIAKLGECEQRFYLEAM